VACAPRDSTTTTTTTTIVPVAVSTVDASVATGQGPIRVVDATPGSADALDDAPFQPGTSWTEPSSGAVFSFDEARGDSLQVTVEPAD
jgi:hypothetical protein